MRVFIASNYREFRRERAALADAVTGLGLRHVAMEQFGASEAAPVEVCIEAVRRSELMLALIGRTYGSAPPDETRSFTHVEIETALEHGIPVIPYMRAGLPLDSDEALGALLPADFVAVLRRLGERHTIRTFADAGELERQALVDVAAAVERLSLGAGDDARSRDDWLRAGLDALEAGDAGRARRLFFRLANAGDPRGQRWLALTELLFSPRVDAFSDFLRLMGQAGIADDARAQSIVRAMATCAPAWFDGAPG